MESLRAFVGSIAAILIFTAFFEMLVPTGKFKKTLTLVCGFLILLTLINPVLKLFDIDTDKIIAGYDSLITDTRNSSYKENGSNPDSEKNDYSMMTLELYKGKLREIIEKTVMSTEIHNMAISKVITELNLTEDYLSPEFGKVEFVYLSLELKKIPVSSGNKNMATDKSISVNIEKIDRVSIVNSANNVKRSGTANSSDYADRDLFKKSLKDLRVRISDKIGIKAEQVILKVNSNLQD